MVKVGFLVCVVACCWWVLWVVDICGFGVSCERFCVCHGWCVILCVLGVVL